MPLGFLRALTVAALLPVLPAFAQTAPAKSPTFQFLQKPGPYAVGLRVVEQYDRSRPTITDELGKPYPGDPARPLQTLIWYPAEKSNSPSMTVGDYFNLIATETSFGKPTTGGAMQSHWQGLAPAFHQQLWAVRDAKPVSGRFPVVIYAPSFTNVSWQNADLCEYLATHGYVVIASPDMGASTRLMTQDLQGIDAQARDISFLIGFAQTLTNTDMSRVAVGGYSWGGISNLFAAARDNRIDALFALDGSMRYYPGLVKRADIHPESMTIPLLFFTQGAATIEDYDQMLANDDAKGPNVMNQWTHGDLITVDDLALTHNEHASMSQRNEDWWKGDSSIQQGDYGREDAAIAYSWIARYTLAFLDDYLKHDPNALAFLKKTPAENGVPPHMMTVTFRPGSGIPPTLDAFRAELGRKGFDHAGEIYDSIHKQNPDFKLDEQQVNSWGYELLAGKHLPEAIEILKLNVKLNPNSWMAYDSLGEAYMDAGQKQLAIENYKKSLELNPGNTNAADKLKELQKDNPK